MTLESEWKAVKQRARRSVSPGVPLTTFPFIGPSAAVPGRHLAIGADLDANLCPGRIELCGDIDLVNASALRSAITQEARVDGGHVVLDLTRIRFVDSAALGALYSLSRETDFSIELEVRAGSFVERVIAAGGLERALHIVRRAPD